MKTAIVILNWNGEELLKKFLPTLVSHSPNATIYVADNASEDGSLHYLKATFPEVKIIQNSQNGGYAKGYNDALKNLTEDVYVLLNNDVETTTNWLEPVLEAFQNNPDWVAAQPKILDCKDKTHFEYAGAGGGFLDRLGYPYCRGRIFNSLEKDEGQYNDTLSIFWASGACLFIKKAAFLGVGGFDEDLFAHQEEIDLCWRLQSKGGTIGYVGTSTIYHQGGGTLQQGNPRKTYFNFRNSLLVLFKNAGGTVIWWLIFQRLLLDGIAGMRFLIQVKPLHCWAIVRAHFSFYCLIPKYLKKRRLWASRKPYWQVRSIVWSYFILKNRIFNKL
ncbi:MAG TPA: glycosyltransferase family 2 protein [Flavobacteriaceae bacterium]|nr:glycosyltransferase family 2 protein [Flavobacteriaceae bacterium]MCB9214045.1 glycosyltransferase family 2 protein [Alteromonas sp.]HPF10810.1 glycosyltransferase family 2 protein [Flavobacteriaceae bacterium]HQU20981.1 glycosyltransferase family 2 protein [Flavobacteriaceae bacterium]HQU66277.1 glycosyltransferase family 2 protein [Flavobacteriaceae bacterium]